jgi:hypothetical protein
MRAGVALFACALPVVSAAPGQADPLPTFCAPADVVDNVCTARLTSVTADVINGTITGAPVGGGAPITLAGQLDAYQKSAGFGAMPPDAVQQWDTNLDSVSNLSVDPSDPGWYGNAKSRVFMPRTLNDLAVQFPPDVLVVRFTPDDAAPGTFRLVSIQPVTG